MTSSISNEQQRRPRSALLILLLLVLALVFGLGFAVSGPGISYRLLGGGLAAAGAVTLLAAVLAALYAWLRVRHARAEAAMKPYLDQLDALNDDDLRESALAAIRETGCFTTSPATAPVNPSWPRDVREVFERFDRVAFTLTGESVPFFTLDRAVVDLMPAYRDAVKVGVMSLPTWCVAIHLPTGRTVMSYGSGRPEEIAQSAKSPEASHRNLWHFIAAYAARHRVGLMTRQPKASVEPAGMSKTS